MIIVTADNDLIPPLDAREAVVTTSTAPTFQLEYSLVEDHST